jgi:hypothetical protein
MPKKAKKKPEPEDRVARLQCAFEEKHGPRGVGAMADFQHELNVIILAAVRYGGNAAVDEAVKVIRGVK